MLKKLLLAATITFSLNVFISLSSQSAPQQTVTTQIVNPIQLAKRPDRSWLEHFFQ